MDVAAGSWRYRRPSAAEIVEWCDVDGHAVALPTHFHDEDQVTFVLAGRRRFRLAHRWLALAPGEGVALAAGTPHGSLDEPAGVFCRNAYLPAGTVALPDLVVAVSRLWRRQGIVDEPAFLDLVRDHRLAEAPLPGPMAPTLHGTVTAAAKRTGLSREAFSRAFRRRHGLAPQAFRGLQRLNAARALLRAGMTPAAVATETGFADQSHLGRAFRRAFGVTPGRYRAGSSHPFQTSDGGDR